MKKKLKIDYCRVNISYRDGLGLSYKLVKEGWKIIHQYREGWSNYMIFYRELNF